MKKLTLALAAALSISTAQAADYVIDSKGAHASINFKIQHLGYSWLTGRFNDFKGTFSYDENTPSQATISVTIDTDSIDSNHAERDKHLKRAEFHQFKNNLGQNWSVKIITEGGITVVRWITEGTNLARQSPTEGAADGNGPGAHPICEAKMQ